MPIWQYTAAALHQEDPRIAYYHQSPVSQYSDARTGPSSIPSPITIFPQDGRFTPLISTPTYDASAHRLTHSPPQNSRVNAPQPAVENPEVGDTMEDEDSEEGYTWEVNQSSHSPPPSTTRRKAHRRTQSANEDLLKNAKRAHTVVERNYRERLNDKIADLALYLFETSSDCKSRSIIFFDPHLQHI